MLVSSPHGLSWGKQKGQRLCSETNTFGIMEVLRSDDTLWRTLNLCSEISHDSRWGAKVGGGVGRWATTRVKYELEASRKDVWEGPYVCTLTVHSKSLKIRKDFAPLWRICENRFYFKYLTVGQIINMWEIFLLSYVLWIWTFDTFTNQPTSPAIALFIAKVTSRNLCSVLWPL